MRLLFAHDHRFRPGPAGEIYTPGSFPSKIWDRYLQHFEEVHVIAREGDLASPGDQLARSDHKGVTFEFLPNMSTLRQLLSRSSDSEERMRCAVATSDAVLARLPSEIGLLAVDHARRAGKPYAVEVVGCAWDGAFNYGRLSGRLYAPLSFLRNRSAIGNAPLALYVTSSWLQHRYPTTGETAGVSDVEPCILNQAGEARRDARLAALASGATPVLGTVASLHTRSKGIQTALSALARLKRLGLPMDYRVLGPGPIGPWQELASQLNVSELVYFDGTRPAGEGVANWLDGIDIHLQPSFQEGLPRATIEAMARGAACIGSTCGGIPELIPPDRLHRPGDAAGLANIIRNIAGDITLLATASRADREKVREFDRETLENRRRRFYGLLRTQAKAGRQRRKADR